MILKYRTLLWSSICLSLTVALIAIHRKPLKKFLSAPTQEAFYTTKEFNLTEKIQGLSEQQIKEHETLYQGYVKRRNEITQALTTVDRSNLNRTYAPFRALKVEESYAINGQILHELYFENIGKQHAAVGKQMLELITNDFGSFDAFKKDFMDCAEVSRGWVITAYSFDDGRIHNFVLEEHHKNIPMLIIPLLVLDVYEHAYMIDFGIQRTPYLATFWNNIDWNAVESRITRWVNKLKTP